MLGVQALVHLPGICQVTNESPLPVVARTGRVSWAASLAPARLLGRGSVPVPCVGALFLLSASDWDMTCTLEDPSSCGCWKEGSIFLA